MNGELVGVPWSTWHAVAPCAAVDRGHELRPRSQPIVVPARAGDMRSSERDEYPVSAERTIRTTTTASPTCWLLHVFPASPSATLRSARCLSRPRPGRGARGDGHNQPAREADRLPGPAAIIAPEHAFAVGATPAGNQRISGQACGRSPIRARAAALAQHQRRRPHGRSQPVSA